MTRKQASATFWMSMLLDPETKKCLAKAGTNWMTKLAKKLAKLADAYPLWLSNRWPRNRVGVSDGG